jgi:Na+-driven multidrug efflux pump
MGVGVFIIAFIASHPILSVFSADKNVVSLGAPLFKIATVSFLSCGVQYLAINIFQAMGKATPAFIMSIAQALIFIPLLLILSGLFGITGFAWAQPLADILMAATGALVYLTLRKKMMTER